MADGIQIGNDHERMAEVSANALVQETESSSIQIGIDHERMAEITLSRIFGEIASRIEESEGVQIMNDQENAASASVLAQEANGSIAEVRASEELAPIENDSAPRWLSKSPRGGTERGIQI